MTCAGTPTEVCSAYHDTQLLVAGQSRSSVTAEVNQQFKTKLPLAEEATTI